MPIAVFSIASLLVSSLPGWALRAGPSPVLQIGPVSIADILYILVLLAIVIPILQRRAIATKRLRLIRDIEKQRGSRVITLIHRQESFSLLGIPIARYIDIEDSEGILRGIRLTPADTPIDIVLHTPGGLVLAAEQIAYALKRHPGEVTVLVPHYAMSGGSLISLAADKIIMDPNAVLGPIDPQIGDAQKGSLPAASILAALKTPNPNRDDDILILGDVANKAIDQVYHVVHSLVKDKMDAERAAEVARKLSEGRWTHDYPITAAQAIDLGLSVDEHLPEKVYELMDYYPQPTQRRPSVEYIPIPYQPAPRPGKTRDWGHP